jgi:8-oxo-dGTP pyrophosphatase MutT (NUDIX family)
MSFRPVQPIRPAATVILTRDCEGDYEILMLRRTANAAFAGGMYVFPGGRVDNDDHLHRYDQYRRGPTPAQAAQIEAIGAEWRGFWIAGIRESFEEAGVLLAYDENGELLDHLDAERRQRFDSYRHALHDGTIDLDEICQREKLTLAVDRMHFFNRWITPEGRPRRFDTRFFVAVAPPGQRSRHDAKETVDSLWIRPADALAQHEAGQFGLMAVTKRQLETLTRYRNAQELEMDILELKEYPIFRPVLPANAGN